MTGRPTVVIELAADEQRARDLAAGGILVPGCSLELNAECELVVRGPAGELRLDARVVFLDPQRGAGLELIGFGPEMKQQLALLAAAAPPEPAEEPSGDGDDWAAEWADDDPAAPGGEAMLDEADAEPAPGDDAAELEPAPGDDAAELEPAPGDDATELALGSGELDVPADGEPEAWRPIRERLRHLPLAQQIKRAHSGDLQERILLERMYGKTVWEPLLRNPRLTAPEVARIARMATLPRTLIEVIVNNGAWLQIGEIRRALLANRRLQTDQILRVLRVLPKHELKLAAVQTAYPHPVRDAAKRMLRESP